MRTFGTETDGILDQEMIYGSPNYNMTLYHNGLKLNIDVKKMVIHFIGSKVPFGNITKHYVELTTDYRDLLEGDELSVEVEKNGVILPVETFYIKTFDKKEYYCQYTGFSSLLEPDKISLYNAWSEPEYRMGWWANDKSISEILDTFLTPAGLKMDKMPEYDGKFVSWWYNWSEMSLAQLVSFCGVLGQCNYVLKGNTFCEINSAKSSRIAEMDVKDVTYSESLLQKKDDKIIAQIDVTYNVWEYEGSTSEDPMLGFNYSYIPLTSHGSIKDSSGQDTTGASITVSCPLVPTDTDKFRKFISDKIMYFLGHEYNSYEVSFVGDARIELNDTLNLMDDEQDVAQFRISELTWQWDGGLKCIAKTAEESQAESSGTDVSLQEVVQALSSVSNKIANVQYNMVRASKLEAEVAELGYLKAEQADIKYATIQSLNVTDAKIATLDSTTIKTDELYSKVAELGYLKAEQADIKFATIENLNASNAEISVLKSSTIKTTELSAEVAKLGYASVKELEATTAKIDNLTSKAITTDNLTAETAKLGYLTANQADIRYLTASTADAKFLHADMSDMDIAKIQTLFATAGIVSDMTIKDGHITGELSGIKVSANDISAGRLDAATIEVVNLNAANITVGTINGQQIASGAIDLSKLGSDVTAKFADTEDDVAKAVEDAKNAIKAANDISVGGRNLYYLKDFGKHNKYQCSSYNISSDGEITLVANGIDLYIGGQVSAGDNYNVSYGPLMNIQGAKKITVTITNSLFTKNFYNFYDVNKKAIKNYDYANANQFTAAVPDNAVYMSLRFGYENSTSGTTYKLKVKVEKGNKATDWTPAPEDVDSSIDTASIKNWCYDGNLAWMNGAKIYASTIISDAIAADAITAVKIKAGSISADKIAANAVTAGKIAANAVTAGTIAAGAITTDKLSAKAITSEKIATDAVTADKILAKSITATKIAAGTITSDEIASGTIKAANINVTDLVGNSAFINSLKSNTVIVGLQNDINGISVGGRNLLRNSALSNISFPYSSSKYNWRLASIVDGNGISRTKVQITDNNAFSGIVYGVKYTCTNACSTCDIAQDDIRVEDGATYTISAYFKVVKGSGKYRFEYGTNPWPVKSGDIGSGWNKYSYTFTYDKSKFGDKLTTNIYFGFECGANFEGYVCGFKFEKGNRATDWTPAPEDVDSLISAAQSTADSANSLAGTANSAAGAAQSTANTAVSDIKSLDSMSTKAYNFSGASGTAKWVKLGTLRSIEDSKNTIITVYTGNGFNATPSQNSKVEIVIKNGWQSSASSSGAFGVSITSQNWDNPAVKVMASSSEICDVWIYLPWAYWNGNYTISGYRTSWAHSGASQTDEPTSGTAQKIGYRVNAEQAKSVADSAVSTIGKWCYNNDITYINGGKIYTGTVEAEAIKANSITAAQIKAGAITADKLSVDAITSRNYVKDTSGTKISLADGSYDSKYTKINSEGKIECSNIAITGPYSKIEMEKTVTWETSGTITYTISMDWNGLTLAYDSTSLSKVQITHDGLYAQESQIIGWAAQQVPVITNIADVTTTSGASLYKIDNLVNSNSPNNAGQYIVKGINIYQLRHCDTYMEVACNKGVGAYGVTWWESDARLKENFTPVNFDVLDCIRNLKFKAFDWKDKSKENIHQRLGLVADEVQCIIPEAVFEVGENKIKNINTGIMSTYALKGVQDLYARIRLLEHEVINLQNQLLQKGNQNG